jgi:hypothetical protein
MNNRTTLRSARKRGAYACLHGASGRRAENRGPTGHDRGDGALRHSPRQLRVGRGFHRAGAKPKLSDYHYEVGHQPNHYWIPRKRAPHSKATKNLAAIGTCPICGQGRLIISRDNASQKLFVLCEECESEWDSPEASRSLDNATRDVRSQSTMLERDDLIGHPWHSSLWS